MKREKYLTVLFIICFISYFMMINMSMTAEAEEAEEAVVMNIIEVKKGLVLGKLREIQLQEHKLIHYVSLKTNFQYEDAKYLIKQCEIKNFDPFILLGLIKKESNFNPYALGLAGERGLGQLMENTAKPIAENLGHAYNPNNLYDTNYNLEITITQLSYLFKLYNGDIHKTLTAYNRGQQGLKDYIEQNASSYNNPAMSEYSIAIMNFAREYKEEFENF